MDDGNAINSGGVAVFIAKVWRIVEDAEYQHLISWSESGKTVLIHDYSQFSKDVLPQYFKHCNFNSFVRQLNLYGFRKVTKADQGSLLKAQAKEPIEFWHPHFRRGHPEQLPDVQRRPVATKAVAGAGAEEKAPQLTKVVSDVHQISRRQESITTTLDILKQENTHLRREVTMLKDKHEQQQKVLDKIIQFLLHMVYKGRISPKRKQPPLMLMDIPSGTPNKRQKLDDKDLFSFEPTVEIEAINSQPYSEQQLSEALVHVQSPEIDRMLPHSSPTTTLPTEDLVQSPNHPQALLTEPFVGTAPLAPVASPTTPFNLDLIPELSVPTSVSEMPAVSEMPTVSEMPAAMLSSISDRISSQQMSIDAIHELLATGSLTIDPAIFSEYMNADINYTPGYDTVDTACLLESLSGGEDDVQTNGYSIEPLISSHLEDTTTDPSSAFRELLETTPAHITDTTTAITTTTTSTVRSKQ
eukprot:Em0018g186a